MNTFDVRELDLKRMLKEGAEVPLFVGGKDSGSRVRLIPIVEDEEKLREVR